MPFTEANSVEDLIREAHIVAKRGDLAHQRVGV